MDLLRFLAYDDPETKLALMLLHKLRIVESDIVPLVRCEPIHKLAKCWSPVGSCGCPPHPISGSMHPPIAMLLALPLPPHPFTLTPASFSRPHSHPPCSAHHLTTPPLPTPRPQTKLRQEPVPILLAASVSPEANKMEYIA